MLLRYFGNFWRMGNEGKNVCVWEWMGVLVWRLYRTETTLELWFKISFQDIAGWNVMLMMS